MALSTRLPWTKKPLIVNAPMGGFAGPDLALAVSRAGGLGQIGAVNNMQALADQLDVVAKSLSEKSLPDNASSTLPIGVGFLLFITKLDEAVAVVRKYRPAVIWLFAAHDSVEDYARWSEAMRSASPDSMIWTQVGSSAALALQVAKTVKPDALVIQGTDAGGHGFERGASIVSLLPETLDVFAQNGMQDIPVLAAGGIVDERTAAAAFALGAAGVVMGTRFLAARETVVNPAYRERVLAAHDGAMSTVRAKVFDELPGRNAWPVLYDGRALVSRSWHEWKGGEELGRIVEKHKEAVKGQDAGFGSESDRAAIWAGTGVGMVNKEQGAGEIVEEVRGGIMGVLDRTKSRL